MLLKLLNVLTASELASINQALQGADWIDGRITAGAQAATVKHNQQLDPEDSVCQHIRQIVLQALQHDPLFYSAVLPDKILPPFVNRYTGNSNYYGWHVDSALRAAPEGGRLRTDVSATLFLNAPDQYEGGELVIQDTFGEQCIKLAAGSLVVYPASSVHAVLPVTQGQRLACFMFIQSLVRDTTQRRYLFELDMALVKLRQQVGENAEVVSLTGLYHNLLRSWSA